MIIEIEGADNLWPNITYFQQLKMFFSIPVTIEKKVAMKILS